jgi:hypothetical protein
MPKRRITCVLFVWAMVVSGCGLITGRPGTIGKVQAKAVTPAAASPTASQPGTATSAPALPATAASTQSLLIRSCALLNSYDIASLFTQARTEMQTPVQQDSQVSHPIFSPVNAPGREYSCIFYGFINPDVKDMRLLQITYWVDIPDPQASSQWDQAWSQMKTNGGKAVPGLAQAAYFDNGRLTLQQRNVYITIEAIGEAVSAVNGASSDPQLNVEKLVAEDILKKLQ